MKLFRTIASLFAVAALSAAAFAQNPAVFGGVANAYAFAYGLNPKVAPLQVDMTSGRHLPARRRHSRLLSVRFPWAMARLLLRSRLMPRLRSALARIRRR